jgi:cyclopropane-fatty-acyl-phospholipid synthase
MRAKSALLGSGPAVLASGLVDYWCLSRLSKLLRGAPIRLQLWNDLATRTPAPPVATVVVNDRRTLFRLVCQPSLAFGEAYTAGRVIVHGDLVRLLETVNRALAGLDYESVKPRSRNSLTAAKDNVHAHYDLGNDFYRLWLDEQLIYTCAYFEREDASLEDAQRAKLDYVCRKLRLRPGDRVIEAGCGWGALALHMARHYGVHVRAFNISEAQLTYARDRATAEGLSDRVTFVNGDYRSIDGRCDAFASVGMIEHIGPADYAALGAVIDRVLAPDHGRAFLHFIGRNAPREFNPWIERHVFPGAYAPALSEVLPGLCEGANLSVLDLENLRPHYALTLKHWLNRFDAHVDEVRAMFDDEFVRTWRLYLASSQACFLTGDLELFQIICSRVANPTQLWTRHALYRDGTGDAGPGEASSREAF